MCLCSGASISLFTYLSVLKDQHKENMIVHIVVDNKKWNKLLIFKNGLNLSCCIVATFFRYRVSLHRMSQR